MSLRRKLNRWAWVAVGVLAPLFVVSAYYNLRRDRCAEHVQRSECERFAALESLACRAGMQDNWVVGACARAGVRYTEGLGVAADFGRGIGLLRQGCSARFRNEAACVLAWSYYNEAFRTPHLVVGWTGHFEGPTYDPYWRRNLNEVRTEAESLCAMDRGALNLAPNRRELVSTWCAILPNSRLAARDVSANATSLRDDCDAGRAGACLLAGTATALGLIGVHDVPRGVALLRKACELGSETACDETADGGKRSWYRQIVDASGR